MEIERTKHPKVAKALDMISVRIGKADAARAKAQATFDEEFKKAFEHFDMFADADQPVSIEVENGGFTLAREVARPEPTINHEKLLDAVKEHWPENWREVWMSITRLDDRAQLLARPLDQSAFESLLGETDDFNWTVAVDQRAPTVRRIRRKITAKKPSEGVDDLIPNT